MFASSLNVQSILEITEWHVIVGYKIQFITSKWVDLSRIGFWQELGWLVKNWVTSNNLRLFWFFFADAYSIVLRLIDNQSKIEICETSSVYKNIDGATKPTFRVKCSSSHYWWTGEQSICRKKSFSLLPVAVIHRRQQTEVNRNSRNIIIIFLALSLHTTNVYKNSWFLVSYNFQGQRILV